MHYFEQIGRRQSKLGGSPSPSPRANSHANSTCPDCSVCTWTSVATILIHGHAGGRIGKSLTLSPLNEFGMIESRRGRQTVALPGEQPQRSPSNSFLRHHLPEIAYVSIITLFRVGREHQFVRERLIRFARRIVTLRRVSSFLCRLTSGLFTRRLLARAIGVPSSYRHWGVN